MKKIYFIILFFSFVINSNAQSERTLEETKSYIIKLLDQYAWKNHSEKKRPTIEFEGDLLKLTDIKAFLGKPLEGSVSYYNFSNVFRFKGPIRESGDIAILVFWADYATNRSHTTWKKRSFEIEVHSYDAGEQLMIAFKHLNKLLIEKKQVEKF